MYELSAIGAFLCQQNSSDLSQRYIDYRHIQAYKDEKSVRECGNKFHTDSSFENLKRNYDLMLKKYGHNFKNSYGWANAFFGRTENNSKVTFSEIVKEADMDKLYGYYQTSSTHIHGNHKANQESLGLMPDFDRILLIGPSNYGLSLPLQNAAISLVLTTEHFLLTRQNLDVLVACYVLDKILEKALTHANETQTDIEKREYAQNPSLAS